MRSGLFGWLMRMSNGERPARADWAGVAAPSITEVKQNGGNIDDELANAQATVEAQMQ